jgi:iron complex transport system substrate-binding protein
MPNARATHLTRRGILAAGGALGLGAALTACGDDDAKSGGSNDGTAAAKSGPWSFKDDRGKTVELDKVPANLVAFTGVAAALWDYGVQVKGVFGPTTTKDGKPDVQAGDLDVDKVTVLGNEWGKLNVEKYAALAPERAPCGPSPRSPRTRSPSWRPASRSPSSTASSPSRSSACGSWPSPSAPT